MAEGGWFSSLELALNPTWFYIDNDGFEKSSELSNDFKSIIGFTLSYISALYPLYAFVKNRYIKKTNYRKNCIICRVSSCYSVVGG